MQVFLFFYSKSLDKIMELLGGSNTEPARSLFWLHPAIQSVYTERTDIPVHMYIY